MIIQRLDRIMPARIPRPVIDNRPRTENDPVTSRSVWRSRPGCRNNNATESKITGRMIHRDFPIQILSTRSET